jgi:DNA-binding response OmpR family regulator
VATRIFIVDDKPSMAGTAALLVTFFGYEPVQCYYPKEALARLLAEPFDALLTDYEMPGMTGLDLVQRLRDEGCLVPVVLMSGGVAAIDPFHARQLGVMAILAKPFGMAELEAALRSALGGNRGQK